MDSNPDERGSLPALPASFGTAPSTARGVEAGTPGPAPVPPARTGPAADPGTEVEPSTGTALSTVVPLTRAERASTDLQYRLKAELVPGRPLHALIHGKGDSLRDHRARIKNPDWVPEELEGRRSAAFLAKAGTVHHVIVARTVKAAAKAVQFVAAKVDQAADTILLFYGLLFLLVALIALLVVYI